MHLDPLAQVVPPEALDHQVDWELPDQVVSLVHQVILGRQV